MWRCGSTTPQYHAHSLRPSSIKNIGDEPAAQHAGYTDWRLPTAAELAARDTGAGLDPVFHNNCLPGCTVCSCTQYGFYWSSTTVQTLEFKAYGVDFSRSAVGLTPEDKGFAHYVQAVRGGP